MSRGLTVLYASSASTAQTDAAALFNVGVNQRETDSAHVPPRYSGNGAKRGKSTDPAEISQRSVRPAFD
ncbi:hypothetical protein JZ751_004575 [Albula glossodonta]|uniref:Uncharacterized protein n=1 Tax=Albula glossodonta TaxID=121402 RepID=A0A8T2N682_9TELE|nr:hypothetical protein JZ751_029791 [Albula glossodonta]KAG9335446.1 hypothetical protein JZ751_004575 [Albula glossodonta]